MVGQLVQGHEPYLRALQRYVLDHDLTQASGEGPSHVGCKGGRGAGILVQTRMMIPICTNRLLISSFRRPRRSSSDTFTPPSCRQVDMYMSLGHISLGIKRDPDLPIKVTTIRNREAAVPHPPLLRDAYSGT